MPLVFCAMQSCTMPAVQRGQHCWSATRTDVMHAAQGHDLAMSEACIASAVMQLVACRYLQVAAAAGG
jgi:hypothetical protein